MSQKNNLRYSLALLHMKDMPLSVKLHITENYKPLANFFNLPPGALDAAGFSAYQHLLKRPDWEKADQALHWQEAAAHHHIVTLDDEDYPASLKMVRNRPLLLFVRGDKKILNDPQIALVGSRNPTPIGKEQAYLFARALSEVGLVITSGLALGIDAQSHEGALSIDAPTIAVMGTSIDVIYPRQHLKLASRIEHQGALISEFPLQTPPMPRNFPMRNRIISGMSLGVLVAEAAEQSGSLITARCALEQNREVFAIPGPINNPLARGCHKLLREGAKLVENVNDILEEIAPTLKVSLEKNKLAQSGRLKLRSQAHDLLKQVSYAPEPMDKIIERSQLPPEEVSSILMELEMSGAVIKSPHGYHKRITTN